MTAKLIDGKLIANNLLEELKEEIAKRQQDGIRNPALAVVLVGDDPASTVYVNNKRKECEKVGIKSLFYDLPATTSQSELEKLPIHPLSGVEAGWNLGRKQPRALRL